MLIQQKLVFKGFKMF